MLPPEKRDWPTVHEATGRYYECLGMVRRVARALEVLGYDADSFDDTWDPDHHVEVTLMVKECRKILEIERKYGKPLDGGMGE